jgi:hypothetical protein
VGPKTIERGRGAEPPPYRPHALSSPACSSLTRTLDSGIGTFPPPDHGSSGTPSKNLPKTKPPRLEPPPGVPPTRPPALTKVPRRAHTLEREVPGIEELLVSGRHPSMPAFPALLATTPGHRGHQTCPDGECPGRWVGRPQTRPWELGNSIHFLFVLGQIPVNTQALLLLSSWLKTGPSPTPGQPAAPLTPSYAHPGSWRGCPGTPW